MSLSFAALVAGLHVSSKTARRPCLVRRASGQAPHGHLLIVTGPHVVHHLLYLYRFITLRHHRARHVCVDAGADPSLEHGLAWRVEIALSPSRHGLLERR